MCLEYVHSLAILFFCKVVCQIVHLLKAPMDLKQHKFENWGTRFQELNLKPERNAHGARHLLNLFQMVLIV